MHKLCSDCGRTAHEDASNYHPINTLDIIASCGICRTSRLDADGLLFCLHDDNEENIVGHYYVCGAFCRLYSSEIVKRYNMDETL